MSSAQHFLVLFGDEGWFHDGSVWASIWLRVVIRPGECHATKLMALWGSRSLPTCIDRAHQCRIQFRRAAPPEGDQSVCRDHLQRPGSLPAIWLRLTITLFKRPPIGWCDLCERGNHTRRNVEAMMRGCSRPANQSNFTRKIKPVN